MLQIKNILVATDFGDAAEAALDYGAGLARNLDATLHVVHVADADHVDLSHELERLRLAVDPLTALTTRAVVLRAARPVKALLDYARDKHIDLILSGTEGREGGAGLLQFFAGGIVENLVRNSPCPVMTIRAPVGTAA